MKTLSVVKLASVLGIAVFALGAAAIWSAGQSLAAVPVSIGEKATESNSVQDTYHDQDLQMKLLMHRPGQALAPVIVADHSC